MQAKDRSEVRSEIDALVLPILFDPRDKAFDRGWLGKLSRSRGCALRKTDQSRIVNRRTELENRIDVSLQGDSQSTMAMTTLVATRH